MQDKLINIILFFVCIVLTTGIIAEPAKLQDQQIPQLSPNTIELLVNDYDSVEREKSFVQAFKLMLIKISNNQNIVNLPAIKAAFSNPGFYIRQFNYVNKGTLFLQISFDLSAINNLLQRVSGKVAQVNNKPLTLIWLAKDVGMGKILADEGVDDGLTNILRKKAQELGMPVILPSLDLQDINSMKVYDICHFNIDVIKTASRRYGTSVIAIGCIKPPTLINKVWSSQWLLLQGTKSDRFSFTGKSAESVITQALQKMANSITNVVTHVSGQDTRIVLRITNVNGLDQYNEIVRYLHNFSNAITQIDLINISSTEIELAINVVGGQEVLLNALNMQDKLVPNPDIVASPPGIDLDYKWVILDEKSQTTSSGPLS